MLKEDVDKRFPERN